mgnify:CR=1 FL=1
MSRFKLANLIAYGFVSLFSIYVLMPIIVMVLTTFKSKREIFLEPLGLPSQFSFCLLYTSPSPRDKRQSRMPSSA